jgi:pyruvate kinase
MIESGVDVLRLNFSHGTHETHRSAFGLVREEAAGAGRHVAVLGDLRGPKIRTGRVSGGAITLSEGAMVAITSKDIVGSPRRISTTYPALHKEVGKGDSILLDDGRLKLLVTEVAGEEVRCRVDVGGVLMDHKGMNIPGTPLAVSALSEKDRADLDFAVDLGVDFLALSFVRTAEDVTEAKQLAGEIPVIAKIEKPEAIHNLGGIIEAADGIMVARGDLGVEAGAEKVPILQKRIIRDAGISGLPVIVATQMMESMINSPEPTRAEVSDVANAVLDGADAVMLSGETAVGAYPVEAVRRMAAIIKEVESSDILPPKSRTARLDVRLFSSAIAGAAVAACRDFGIETIAVYTESGRSAELMSANRPSATIVALSRHLTVLRRLALRWGLASLHSEWQSDSDAMVSHAKQKLLENGYVSPGDRIAVAFGLGEPDRPFQTDTLKLIEVD